MQVTHFQRKGMSLLGMLTCLEDVKIGGDNALERQTQGAEEDDVC